MNSIAEIYNALINEISTHPEIQIDEDLKSFRILNINSYSEKLLKYLKEFNNYIRSYDLGDFFLRGEISGEINVEVVDYESIQNEALFVTVLKKNRNYFLSVDGFKKHIQGSFNPSNEVYINYDFDEFESFNTNFVRWTTDKKFGVVDKSFQNPNKIVRDLTNKNLIPSDIRNWLLKNAEVKESEIFNAWKIAFVNKLFPLVSNEIYLDKENIILMLKGIRNSNIIYENPTEEFCLNVFSTFYNIIEWIFVKKEESESKHTIFSYYFSLELANDKNPFNINYFKNAFENAKSSYNYHLINSSKEFLTSLGELKSQLNEEVGKINSLTQNISSNLLRDFALSAVVITLNFLTDINKVTPQGLQILSVATCAFLFISLISSTLINFVYNKNQKGIRSDWHLKVYPFIDNKTYITLVEIPIEKGLKAYRITLIIIYFIYITVILFLLEISKVISLFNLDQFQ